MTDHELRRVLAMALAEAETRVSSADPLLRLRQAQSRLARRRGYALSLAFVGLVTAVQLLPHPALAETRCAGLATCASSAAGTTDAALSSHLTEH